MTTDQRIDRLDEIPRASSADPQAQSDTGDLDDSRSAGSPRPNRPLLGWLAAFGSYIPLSMLALWPVWTQWSQQFNGCSCWDWVNVEWFLGWTPAALAHGHSLFVTNYLDAPGGFSTLWNTSVPVLGVLAAPLTETIGVAHTMGILMALGFALSASTMFALLRRWVQWWPAAWLGGLVYGFSTFAAVEAWQGRLFMVFAAIPPLVVIAVDKAVRNEWSSVKSGLIAGALLAVQLLISEEVFTLTVLALGLSLLVLAAVNRDEVGRRSREIIRWFAACAAVFLVITGYPIIVQFAGPHHLTGPTQSHAQEAIFSSDLMSLFTPWISQWLDPSWANHISGAFRAAGDAEVTEYVGVLLLAFVILTVALLRRSMMVRTLAIVAVVSFWLSMGPSVLVANHDTGIPGPDALVMHLPVLGDIIPARFALVFWFGVAGLFALGLDAGRRWLKSATFEAMQRRSQTSRTASLKRREKASLRAASVGTACIGVLVLVPVIPNWPFPQAPAPVPSFFTSPAVNVVPSGSLVATYPIPRAATAQPMLWQVDAGMRYRMLGGYVVVPDASGAGTFFADGSPIERCFTSVYEDDTSKHCAPAVLAHSVRALGVTSMIAEIGQPNVTLARNMIDRALRAQPQQVGGVFLWRCVPRHEGGPCRWT